MSGTGSAANEEDHWKDGGDCTVLTAGFASEPNVLSRSQSGLCPDCVLNMPTISSTSVIGSFIVRQSPPVMGL